MNDLLEALHSMLVFILEDAHANKLDRNHIEQARYRYLRADMARFEADLGFYLDQIS